MQPSTRAYLDHAATTPMDSEVLQAMLPYLTDHFGNPSSIHASGRKARAAVEDARRLIASLLHTHPASIVFCSGGTEANNWALRSAVLHGQIKQVVSSPLEHHAVLYTLQDLQNQGLISLKMLPVDRYGRPLLEECIYILKSSNQLPTLVSVMHANNEVGTLIDLHKWGEACKQYGAWFHSDTVQTLGQFPFHLDQSPLDMAVASAHKFYGPKGVGFAYYNRALPLRHLHTGGGQERGLRPGTENIPAIVGMAKALEIAQNRAEQNAQHLATLKKECIAMLNQHFSGWTQMGDPQNSLPSILNIGLQTPLSQELFLFKLDLQGIDVSGGSACSSGANEGSHVLKALGADPNRNYCRISFGKMNTLEHISLLKQALSHIMEA